MLARPAHRVRPDLEENKVNKDRLALLALGAALVSLALWDRWDRRARPVSPERQAHPAYQGPRAVPDLSDQWGRGVLPEPLAYRAHKVR